MKLSPIQSEQRDSFAQYVLAILEEEVAGGRSSQAELNLVHLQVATIGRADRLAHGWSDVDIKFHAPRDLPATRAAIVTNQISATLYGRDH